MTRSSLATFAFLLAASASVAIAQPRATASIASLPLTGTELALEGSPRVRAGRVARFRGVAYQVRGLSTLEPFAGAVRARVAMAASEDGPDERWVTASADAEGRFVMELPIPASARSGSRVARFAVGDAERVFDFPLQVRGGSSLWLRTDRVLYEPDEPVHVFGLLRHPDSGAPIADARVLLRVAGPSIADFSRMLTSDAAGVLHATFELAADAPMGRLQVSMEGSDGTREATTARVGTRTHERVFARLELPEEPVAPGAAFTALVTVTTPSGAPVSGAAVSFELDGRPAPSGRTDAEGRASVELRAPVYHVHSTGRVTVRATASHPAHGSTQVAEPLLLAVPLALTVEVVPPHGGLIPEVDDLLFVRVRDGARLPPAEGTEVSVEGAAIVGGRARARTDANGIVSVPVRVPPGSWSGSREASTATSGIRVEVAGPLAREVHTTVRVLPFASLAPRLDRVLASPGERVSVELLRGPSAIGRPAVVELLDASGALVSVQWAAAGARRVELTLPAARLGLHRVRVRSVDADESLERTGASAALIVRPAGVDYARVEPTRLRWTVGETATVDVRTAPGAPRSWLALSVRDLAAHGGERPFRQDFLAGAFERALIEETDAGARLVRVALAAHVEADPRAATAPPLIDALGRGDAPHDSVSTRSLRDPWPAARELERRGLARAMRRAEARLAQALEAGDLASVVEGAGASRRFREDLFASDEALRTLGGEPLTPSMLRAVDASFDFATVGRRVARRSLVQLMRALAHYLDPGDYATPAQRMAAREPSSRWLSRMVQRGVIAAHLLDDPFGGRFTLRPARDPALVLSARAESLELVSPGPDGRLGTADDVSDPFARLVPAGTPYALASGEDRFLRRLAMSPLAERTIQALTEAYDRTSVEMAEDEIGDAVSAEVGEGTIGLGNLGTIGHGAGGGTGSGYGRGGGGFRGRSARAPRVRTGHAVSGLASIVRERFPPTLLFEPVRPVDASGTTSIEVPLSQAVTTYLVEAIVWREDGWISSADARLEVDREVVVSAPIPTRVHQGDAVRLPLRVSNRGGVVRRLSLRLLGDEALGIPDSAPVALELAPGSGEVVEVEIEPRALGQGTLTAVVTDAEGAAVDAVRRPIEVLAPSRHRVRRVEGFADARTTLELTIPDSARARSATVTLLGGWRLFDARRPSGLYDSWVRPREDEDADVSVGASNGSPAAQSARRLAVMLPYWREQGTPAEVTQAVDALSQAVSTFPEETSVAERASVRADVLLGLARVDADPSTPSLTALRARLLREVASGATALDAAPASWAVSAAALALAGAERARARELLRRVDRHTVEVGDDRWVAAERGAVRATLHAALAEVIVGERSRAFTYLASVGRWHRAGHPLDEDERSIARLVVERLQRGRPPAEAEVLVDGESHTVSLDDGSGELSAPALAEPGSHRVVVRASGVLFVELESRYGMPWAVAPRERGPIELELELAEAAVRDGHATLTIRARNGAPRTLRRAVVEVELPTGLEHLLLSQDAAPGLVRGWDVGEGVLRLELGALPPGARRELVVNGRWSVAGRLVGLGASASDEARPEAIHVLQPRTIDVATGAP